MGAAPNGVQPSAVHLPDFRGNHGRTGARELVFGEHAVGFTEIRLRIFQQSRRLGVRLIGFGAEAHIATPRLERPGGNQEHQCGGDCPSRRDRRGRIVQCGQKEKQKRDRDHPGDHHEGEEVGRAFRREVTAEERTFGNNFQDSLQPGRLRAGVGHAFRQQSIDSGLKGGRQFRPKVRQGPIRGSGTEAVQELMLPFQRFRPALHVRSPRGHDCACRRKGESQPRVAQAPAHREKGNEATSKKKHLHSYERARPKFRLLERRILQLHQNRRLIGRCRF